MISWLTNVHHIQIPVCHGSHGTLSPNHKMPSKCLLFAPKVETLKKVDI